MDLTENQIEELVAKIGTSFRCFGGGRTPKWSNPIAEALKDQPFVFAAGVPVIDVVRFIIKETNHVQTQKETSSD